MIVFTMSLEMKLTQSFEFTLAVCSIMIRTKS